MEPLNINLENIVSNQEQTERAIDTNMEFDFDDVECMVLNGYFHNAHSIQKQLGLNSVEEVWEAVREHRIFYVLFKGMRYFPTFYGSQICEQKELEGITKALKYMPSPLKIEFFLKKRMSLDGLSPLQALEFGQFEKVKEEACAFAKNAHMS